MLRCIKRRIGLRINLARVATGGGTGKSPPDLGVPGRQPACTIEDCFSFSGASAPKQYLSKHQQRGDVVGMIVQYGATLRFALAGSGQLRQSERGFNFRPKIPWIGRDGLLKVPEGGPVIVAVARPDTQSQQFLKADMRHAGTDPIAGIEWPCTGSHRSLALWQSCGVFSAAVTSQPGLAKKAIANTAGAFS
jgi:hypothetical protein